MSAAVRILALAGSVRADSFNKRLVRIAAEGAREAGAEVTLVDLKDFPLPLFDEDLEAAQGRHRWRSNSSSCFSIITVC